MEELDNSLFEKFAGLIYDKSGIMLSAEKRIMTAGRLAKRVRKLGLKSFRDYYKYLSRDTSGRELVELLNVISTNTTDFFRAPRHFEVLGDHLREWYTEGQRKFRIWSAACSSGEETYTIGLTLLDNLSDTCDMRILGTDISVAVLQKAKQGQYTAEDVENVPEHLKKKYFVSGREDGSYHVKAELKNMIAFAQLNLAHPPYPMRGPFDAVFCRNVMIYFDEMVRRRLLDEILRLLKPGGLLFVGRSESLAAVNARFANVEPAVYMKSE